MINKNRISIANPDLHNNPYCILGTDTAASSSPVVLNVSSVTGFPDAIGGSTYFYIVIGNYGDEKAEIVKITAKTDTTLTATALKFSHSASDLITYIPYNQIKFYGRVSSGSTNNLLSTINIDPTQQYSVYEYTGLDYSYFVITFYNDYSLTESDESDEITVNTFTFYSVKKIIEAGMRKAMVKISENQVAPLGWNSLIDLVNEGLSEILTKKKRWQCLHKTKTGNYTVAGTPYVDFPDDLSVMEFLYVNGKKVDYITKTRFSQYVTNGINNSGTPYFYTIKNGKIYLYPTPDNAYEVGFEYYALPETITTLTQEIKKEFATPLIYFIAAQASYINNNEKRGDKMETLFQNVTAQQIEDVTGEEQAGDAQSVELTSSYGEEDPYFDLLI